MIYRAIGITSGGEPASLDIAFVEFTAAAGNWQYEVMVAEQIVYTTAWQQQLKEASNLIAFSYQLLHAAYGKFIGEQVNEFIDKHALHHKVQLVICDGHSIFESPENKLSVQLGSGAAIATTTGLAVITDLRTMDATHGGNIKKTLAKASGLLFPDRAFDEDTTLVPFETTVLVALLGVLRWREEATTLIAATGAEQPSIGGAVWLGNEA